jgi:Bacterial Ig-like domain (group 2)
MREYKAWRSMLVLLVAMVGCGAPPSQGSDEGDVMLTADLTSTPVSTLAVQVTAPDISVPLVFNLTVTGGTANGVIKVPPGAARTITVSAFDSTGAVTHQGSKTVDVSPGPNPPVSIPMVANAGQVPITVQIGPVSIVVAPTTVTLAPGATQGLTATITAPNGDHLAGPPEWATSNPAIATVSSSGVVTAVIGGNVDIVATFAGVAAVCHVTVSGIVIYGNSVEFSSMSSFSPDFLLGQKVAVTQPIQLTHLALIAKSAGANVKLALYTDNGSHPDQLVTSTNPTPVVAGPLEIPVVPTALAAGDYWIMGIYDASANIAVDDDISMQVDYISLPFSSPLPQTFPSPITYTGQHFNYYLKGTTAP